MTIPTVAEYARMSWYARKRAADRVKPRGEWTTRDEADQLLDAIPLDPPRLIAQRREALLAEVYRRTR